MGGADRNPYAPPTSAVSDPGVAVDAATLQLRRDHVRHERLLRSTGSLYWFFTLLVTITAAVAIGFGSLDGGRPVGSALALVVAIYGGLIFAVGAVAYGLSRLRSWVRIPAIVLSVLGLLIIPVGTIINGYVLYLLLSKQGATILAPGYAEVMTATPEVRFQRTTGDWIALGIVVVLLLGLMLLLGTLM